MNNDLEWTVEDGWDVNDLTDIDRLHEQLRAIDTKLQESIVNLGKIIIEINEVKEKLAKMLGEQIRF
jgi:hypothetical protein